MRWVDDGDGEGDVGDCVFFFFFQAEDGIRDSSVTGVQTCALPICEVHGAGPAARDHGLQEAALECVAAMRSEEHTSELQSHLNLVCRLLLEKKKKRQYTEIMLYIAAIYDHL